MEIIVGKLITPFEMIPRGAILIDNARIKAVIREPDPASLPAGVPVTTVDDGFILPGLVDIHNHGGAGLSYMDAAREDFSGLSAYLASHGVTSALAATSAAPMDTILSCLQGFRGYAAQPGPGCRLLGIHLEGPYLSVKNKGAQPENHLLSPRDGYEFILDNADIIRMVTLSPELDGVLGMIRDLKQAGIIISGGHDDAAAPEILEAIDAGMSHTTHIYCAMSTLPKRGAIRYAGLCEIAMTDDRLTTEMIADNHHIPPILARMIYRCKGADRLCLVSDSIQGGGLPEDGRQMFLGSSAKDGQPIIILDGVAMLPDQSRYAGSIQALDRMIGNVVQDAGIPIQDAVRMASLTPARILGLDRERGSLEPGKQADICIMDSQFQVQRTIIDGQTVYSSRAESIKVRNCQCET